MSLGMRRQALVCEDNPALRSAFNDLVEAHGWTTVEVSTATDAIDKATALHPDLVLVDIGLVGMSGLESIPRLRAGSPDVRVVALSDSRRGLDLCLGAGACAVVQTSDLARLDEILTGLEIREAEEAA